MNDRDRERLWDAVVGLGCGIVLGLILFGIPLVLFLRWLNYF